MDLDRARERLSEERRRLLETKARLEDRGFGREPEQDLLGELSSYDQHPADEGTETFEEEKTLSILEQVEAELEDVDRALARLDRGDYGECEICGRPIGDERLDARPWSRYCVEDQGRLERQIRPAGGPE